MSKLNNIIQITGTLTLETGLHIGAGDTEMHIGGIDNGIVKHPYTNQPYIPGSSLKGKIRSLLEWHAGVVGLTDGSPVQPKDQKKCTNEEQERTVKAIIKLFGYSGDNTDEAAEIGPTRLAFHDLALQDAWVQERKNANQSMTEAKSENTIDRISGTAKNPRQTERVPAGAVFDFKLNVKILDADDEESLMDTLATGLKLLEMDSLGGSGSRGYGKIKLALQGIILPANPFAA